MCVDVERDLRLGVTQLALDLLDGRALPRRERRARVPEVVKAEPVALVGCRPQSLDRRPERALLEVVVTDRRPGRRREDQCVRIGGDVLEQMLGEVSPQSRRERNRPLLAVLGRAEDEALLGLV